MPINLSQMFRNRHLYPEYLYNHNLISKEKLIEFRLKKIKQEAKSITVGIFCNTEYIEKLYDKFIGTQSKIKKVKYSDDLNGIEKLFCLEYGDDGKDLDNLFLNCSNKNIIIQDQFAWYGNEYFPQFQCRGIRYILNDKTEKPSHFANNQYLYQLEKIIQDFNRPINVMDMCAGSGFIGFSLLNENNKISKLYSIEINPDAINSMHDTITYNKLPEEKIEIINSNVFDNVSNDVKVELVTCNPPHSNRTVRKMTDRGGADDNWDFHDKFFSSISSYLSHDGIITLIERKQSSSIDTFRNMIPSNLMINKVIDLPLTDWYVIILTKK